MSQSRVARCERVDNEIGVFETPYIDGIKDLSVQVEKLVLLFLMELKSLNYEVWGVL